MQVASRNDNWLDEIEIVDRQYMEYIIGFITNRTLVIFQFATILYELIRHMTVLPV